MNLDGKRLENTSHGLYSSDVGGLGSTFINWMPPLDMRSVMTILGTSGLSFSGEDIGRK